MTSASSNGNRLAAEGYWGPITSSVDWCEDNYTYSHYVAEFWNTVSSLAMIFLGLLGVALHHRSLGWRLSGSYLLIVVVGIGSVLFHATLQFEHQMWDEVPMVWTACYLFYVLLDQHGYRGPFYAISITLYCALATYVTSQSKGTTQFFMFQSSFGCVMWGCLWFVRKMYRATQNQEIVRLFHRGAQFLALALGVWLFDKNLCFVYQKYNLYNPQLHAWWHVLVSFLFLCFVMEDLGVPLIENKPKACY
ncbi:alkaline phytoceramidase family protein [Zychaea mexicana]|uniref:alkaline phytoceramidase family protein n=1 Tax=Zychaea mexicana TaxID=64656 RepID=UPI0022FF04FE|nr:alkaline phytoceramidase family protein [Zychaea mexicana]KAI9498028.1 alkaline phytoceramidase family protein [Zychaea mexicana]